ncbi:unnamed protein product, partial [Closterium sp. NIES-53]
QNGIAERRIGMVMDVARTSMIHVAAPHFLWPFAVQYAAHQINLQPRVSLPETTPTLRWTGKVGDAYVFRFYHPTSRRVLSSQDVTFDESVSYYRAPPIDPLPPQGSASSGVSQEDPAEPVEVAVNSGAARGAEPAGARTGGAEPAGARTGGAEPGVSVSEGAEPGGAEPKRVEPGGAVPGGAESGSAEPGGAAPERAVSGGPPGVPSRQEPLSPLQLREWYARRCRGAAGAAAAGGTAGAAGGASGAARGAAGGGVAGGAAGGTGAVGGPAGAGEAGPGGARSGGTGAAGAGGAVGVGAANTGAGGAAGVVAGDPGAEGIGAVFADSGGAPTSPLPGPSPYSERRESESRPVLPESFPASPESRFVLPVRTIRAGSHVSRPRPPPVPGTHFMTLRPSTAPQRVHLPSPPASSHSDGPFPESDSLRAANPMVTRFLATAVTDPLFESTAASALVAEFVDFDAACCLDFATSLVAESAFASVCLPSVGGECALGTDVLEERQEEFECFAVAVPHLVSMLLAPDVKSQ